MATQEGSIRLDVILKSPLHPKFFLLAQNPVPYYALFEPDPKQHAVWDDKTQESPHNKYPENSLPSVHNNIYAGL